MNKMFTNHIFNIYLALNNLQWLVCHKTQPTFMINDTVLEKKANCEKSIFFDYCCPSFLSYN